MFTIYVFTYLFSSFVGSECMIRFSERGYLLTLVAYQRQMLPWKIAKDGVFMLLKIMPGNECLHNNC